MVRFNKTQKLTDKLSSIVESEEVKLALLEGHIRILCDHEKQKFWFERCPEHLWDYALFEIKRATGYTPVDEE